MALDAQDKLKLDYERTFEQYKTLSDIRFRLLGLVPTVTGFTAALNAKGEHSVPVGLFGFMATLGVVFYELRNSRIYDAAISRLKKLETALGLESFDEDVTHGGLFSQRPASRQRLFGIVDIWHDRALALVYGVSLGMWAWLASTAWMGGLVAVTAILEFHRLERTR
jgi:hypothetical protein